MDGDKLRGMASGVSQSGLRAHNERVLLSLIQREGAMPGSALAKRTALSPQTVSVILRGLETDGLLHKGDPVRGKVGKPSVPMDLNPSGAFAFGLKIGRRSAELALMDLCGTLRHQARLSYRYPMPDPIERFATQGMAELAERLTPDEQTRIAGLGIAAPYQIWNWHDSVSAPENALDAWREVNLAERLQAISGLPVETINDATAACRAEHSWGLGRTIRDYAYFYVGAYIGGGIVLDGEVVEGRRGNAGAFGPLPASDGKRLIDTASLFLLEQTVEANGKDSAGLWTSPPDWAGFEAETDAWCKKTGWELAQATLTVYAVLDLEMALIDGAFPDHIRASIVAYAQEALTQMDTRWLLAPRIEAGSTGAAARVLGAASGPIFAAYF